MIMYNMATTYTVIFEGHNFADFIVSLLSINFIHRKDLRKYYNQLDLLCAKYEP